MNLSVLTIYSLAVSECAVTAIPSISLFLYFLHFTFSCSAGEFPGLIRCVGPLGRNTGRFFM